MERIVYVLLLSIAACAPESRAPWARLGPATSTHGLSIDEEPPPPPANPPVPFELGDAGGGAAAPVEPIACGQQECQLPSLLTELPLPVSLLGGLGFPLQSCCDEGDRCGVNLDGWSFCVELDAPGTTRPECEGATIDVFGLGYPLPGCCAPSGLCGLRVDELELGCVEPAEVEEVLRLLNQGAQPLPRTRCTF